MGEKIIKRINEEVAELDEYVKKNKRNIEKLKEQYEKAVKINKCFIERIKAMKKEVLDLRRGMNSICHVHEVIFPIYSDDKE